MDGAGPRERERECGRGCQHACEAEAEGQATCSGDGDEALTGIQWLYLVGEITLTFWDTRYYATPLLQSDR